MLVNHKQHFAKFCQHIKHQTFNISASTDYHFWGANLLIKMLFSHHFALKNEQNIVKKLKSSKFQEKPFTPPHQQKKHRFHPLKQDKIGTIIFQFHFTDPSQTLRTHYRPSRHQWDLTSGVQNREICEICVSLREQELPWIIREI